MKIKTTILIALALSIVISCTNEDNAPQLFVKASANYTNVKTKADQANIELSKFKINLREIELEYDDDIEDDNYDDTQEHLYDDLEFEGPFELDLLSGATQINIAAAEVPIDTYEEIEFDMSRSIDTASDMYDKSILIEGTIDGTPFVFWHDSDEEFEVDYANAANDIVMTGNDASIVINFDLNIIFGATSGIDFSTAIDGNQDGLIEIHPGDDDGNSRLADFIKELLHESADLLDD